MSVHIQQKLVAILDEAAHPLTEDKYDYLLNKIGDARFVLIGEATHGTHEFYQIRSQITKQLLEKKGFMAVAIEGDWPDAYCIHRFIQQKDNSDINDALAGFKRFPTWMWRNTAMPPFLNWLHTFNKQQAILRMPKIGFYGLDLYSLHSSMQAVIQYLYKVDAKAAHRAEQRYACFNHIHIDPQAYGYLAYAGIKKNCIKEAVEQLLELQHRAFDYLCKDNSDMEENYFFATQNARLVKNAETYYRSMFAEHTSSWNIRDRHMAEMVNVLTDHLETRFNRPAKMIIWAHNSHIGDARATEMGEDGEVNIGQLVREQYHPHTYLIGFSTYEGFVTAASNWDAPAEYKKVIPALKGSYEDLFHALQYKNFILDLTNRELEHFLKIPRLQRAIGVVYRPETERASHYYFTRLPYQFDCMIHLDKTNAVQPLDDSEEWERGRQH